MLPSLEGVGGGFVRNDARFQIERLSSRRWLSFFLTRFKENPSLNEGGMRPTSFGGTEYWVRARPISSGVPFCRINAAFRRVSERCIYAAEKNFVVCQYWVFITPP